MGIKEILKKLSKFSDKENPTPQGQNPEDQGIKLSTDGPSIYHESIEVLNATPSFHHLFSLFQSVLSELRASEKEFAGEYYNAIKKYVSRLFELYPDYSIVVTPLARVPFDQPVYFFIFTRGQEDDATRKIMEFMSKATSPAIILVKNQDLGILEKSTKSLSSLVRQGLSLKPEPKSKPYPTPGKYRVFISKSIVEGVPISDVVLIWIFLESFAHKPAKTLNVSFSVKVYRRAYVMSNRDEIVNKSNANTLIYYFPELKYKLEYPERQGPYLGEFIFATRSDETEIINEVKGIIDRAMEKAELFLSGLDLFSSVSLEDITEGNVIYGKKIIAEVLLSAQEKVEQPEKDKTTEPESTTSTEEPSSDTSEREEEKEVQYNLPYIQKETFSQVVSMAARTVVREIKVDLEGSGKLIKINVDI